jgi:predicted outer membrane repeat protein
MNAIEDRVRSIFLAAVERAPGEWATLLDEACGTDADLRARVEQLLHAHQAMGSIHAGAAGAAAGTTDEPRGEDPGTIIGPYKLIEQIGEGGMGTVYMAQQTEPVKRLVALKLIKPGMDSHQVIARFEAERQALALMDHPHIARVFDGGTTNGEPGGGSPGRPYFVMELVKGVPITRYCDEQRLTPRERLELFIPVCQAIQHAHQKGIIHRDVKPSNVLVAMYDGKPVPKVIDFGVAKATGQQLTEHTLVTGFGTVVGTLEYMSPEQAELNQLDIDTRSDVYSLGVLLYELLTGTTPLERKRLKQGAMLEMLRLIREEEPPRPSTRLAESKDTLASISAQRHMEPAKLTNLVRGELDWIVMKALEKDRNRRYETASAFAADVQRYLHDEAVLACPPSAWYRCRKFARRHKAGLRIAAAAALVLLLAVGGVSWALWDQAMRRTELSERMAETEQTVNAALIQTEHWRKEAAQAPSATSPQADAVLALWGQAEAALAQAESALRTGTADDRLRQRVLDVRKQIGQQRAQARRTANLLRDLDDARLTRSMWIETHFDYAGAATKYAAAFAACGLEVKAGDTEELTRRIRAEQPAIREALIVALDDWWQTAARARSAELANLVRALAAAVDDDPWRQKYRAAATAGDATALRALSGQARRLSLPPASLELLALSLSSQGDRDEALALLRWARVRYPGDFWVHFELGTLLDARNERSELEIDEAIGCYTTCLALRPKSYAAYNNLGNALLKKNQAEARGGAIYAFKQALMIDPRFTMAHNGLGAALKANNQLDEAMAEFRQAIHLNPKDALAHYNLGCVLQAKNQLDEAIGEYRKAIKIDPRSRAHSNLGRALQAKNQLGEAITVLRKAIDLDPRNALAHYNLADALTANKQLDEAIAEYRQAIHLDPRNAKAHTQLGFLLARNNQLDEAITEYHQAIKIDPKYPMAHYELGNAHRLKGQWDDAIAAYREAIRLKKDYAEAHGNLGNALYGKGQWDEAIATYREVIRLKNDPALGHNNLGLALYGKGQWDEAIVAFREAIRLKKDYAEAHCNLGGVFRQQGRFAEALAALQTGHKLGSQKAGWLYPSATWVRQVERLIELDGKLAKVLKGETAPANARERLQLASLCGQKYKQLYARSAAWYAEAFAAEPKAAEDLKAGHRYNAACAAALAGNGKGDDASKLTDDERSRLRRQALDWLRADLALHAKRLQGAKAQDRTFVQEQLKHWQRDDDLVGIRDSAALAKLPAAERAAWVQLWAEVATLLRKTSGAKKQ